MALKILIWISIFLPSKLIAFEVNVFKNIRFMENSVLLVASSNSKYCQIAFLDCVFTPTLNQPVVIFLFREHNLTKEPYFIITNNYIPAGI